MKALALTLTTIALSMGTHSAEEMKGNPVEVAFRVSEYIHWYPAIEQQRMMSEWKSKNNLGTWTHTGRVGAEDRTVITPQADVNYGYCWFNISNGPMTIELPKYSRYSSLSIHDMHHFVQDVLISPEKPIVIRLANQKSPIEDAHDIVLETNCGFAFHRMVIPQSKDEEAVLELTKKFVTTGGDGEEAFIIPEFSDSDRKAALEIIRPYGLKQSNANQMFGKTSQGIGDLDRAAGVFLGQLGIPADFVQYQQYVQSPDGKQLGGDGHYEILIDPKNLMHDDKGYWSVTVCSMEDRYLIPNEKGVYSVTGYNARANEEGTYTVRINPDGEGENAIPSTSKDFYAVMRVYQPAGVVEFPPITRAAPPKAGK